MRRDNSPRAGQRAMSVQRHAQSEMGGVEELGSGGSISVQPSQPHAPPCRRRRRVLQSPRPSWP